MLSLLPVNAFHPSVCTTYYNDDMTTYRLVYQNGHFVYKLFPFK